MSGSVSSGVSSEMNNNCLVQLKHINKAFGGVKAVEDVSLNLYPGEVVVVLGLGRGGAVKGNSPIFRLSFA